MLTAQNFDPRYGYPVKMRFEGQSYDAYYLGSSNYGDEVQGFAFVSRDPTLITQAEESTTETVVVLPSLEGVEFLDPPPIGEPVTKVEFKNRHVFVNGKNIGFCIQRVCEGLIHPNVEVGLITTKDGQMAITVQCIFSTPSQLANVLAINELKLLGIWDITTLDMDYNIAAMRLSF